MNISPLKSIPVSYVVLPTDSTLYYVQAILRDTASGKIIQTIDLVQNATYLYRYTGTFKPVPDTSGLGRYIDITIIVYTDSAYSVPSQNYAALLLNYVVLQPWLPTLGSGGGGSIDYEKLRLMIAEMIEGSTKGITSEFPKIPKTDVDYDRIETFMDEIVTILKDELEGHHGQIRTELGGHMKLMTSADLEQSMKMEKNFSELGSTMKMLPKIQDNSLKELRKEIANQLGMTVKEFQKSHKESIKAFEKQIADSARKSGLSMQEYLKKNMGEKEIKFRFDMGEPEAPKEVEKKEETSGYGIEDAMKLLV